MCCKLQVMGGLNCQTMNTVWPRIRIDAGIDGWDPKRRTAADAVMAGIVECAVILAILMQQVAERQSSKKALIGKLYINNYIIISNLI